MDRVLVRRFFFGCWLGLGLVVAAWFFIFLTFLVFGCCCCLGSFFGFYVYIELSLLNKISPRVDEGSVRLLFCFIFWVLNVFGNFYGTSFGLFSSF